MVRSEVDQLRVVVFHVGLPADALVELPVAHFTLETLELAVDPAVLRQILLPRKRFRAHRTRERLLFRVYHYVVGEVAFCVKLELAEGARVRIVGVGQDEVRFVVVPLVEDLAAVGARVGARRLVMRLPHVVALDASREEPLAALGAAKRPALGGVDDVLAPLLDGYEGPLALDADLVVAVRVLQVALQVLLVDVGLAARLARVLVVVAAGVAAELAQAGQLDAAEGAHPLLGAQLEHLHADLDVQVHVLAVVLGDVAGDVWYVVVGLIAEAARQLAAVDLEELRVVVWRVRERRVHVEGPVLVAHVLPVRGRVLHLLAAVHANHRITGDPERVHCRVFQNYLSVVTRRD